jgi:hypothetical protein
LDLIVAADDKNLEVFFLVTYEVNSFLKKLSIASDGWNYS